MNSLQPAPSTGSPGFSLPKTPLGVWQHFRCELAQPTAGDTPGFQQLHFETAALSPASFFPGMGVSYKGTGSSCKGLACSAGSQGDPLPSSGGVESLGLLMHLSKACMLGQECGYQLSHRPIKPTKCCPALQKEHLNPGRTLLPAFMQKPLVCFVQDGRIWLTV